MKKILLFGGSGRLGTALREECPDIIAPTRTEVDINNTFSVFTKINQVQPDVIIHAAALVGTKECEDNKELAWKTNVGGTLNIATACQDGNIKLVFISSAAIFDGEKGSYLEEAIPTPITYYGITKVVGEALVSSLVDNYLIIRLDFFPLDGLKYERIFIDHYTSKIPVSEAAKKILWIAENNLTAGEIINIGGKRDTLYNILKPYYPQIEPIRIKDSALPNFPKDISLDLSKWEEIYGRFK